MGKRIDAILYRLSTHLKPSCSGSYPTNRSLLDVLAACTTSLALSTGTWREHAEQNLPVKSCRSVLISCRNKPHVNAKTKLRFSIQASWACIPGSIDPDHDIGTYLGILFRLAHMQRLDAGRLNRSVVNAGPCSYGRSALD